MDERIVENSNQIITKFGEKIKLYDEQFNTIEKNITLNVLDFGVKGDEVVDDTEALQHALIASNNRTLLVPKNVNCIISSILTLPSNITLDIQGKIIFIGDDDYVFYGLNNESVVCENLNIEFRTSFYERRKLNRAICCENAMYFEVKRCNIVGSSTGIHALNCNTFKGGLIKLKNVLGLEAQYGYGVNSSSKYNYIDTIHVENDDTTNGRHAVYINGSIMNEYYLKNLYVKNFNKNPVNVAITDATKQTKINIDVASFYNCNVQPTAQTTGCVHIADENGENVKVEIGKVYGYGLGGGIVCCLGKCNGISVDEIYASNLTNAYYSNTHLLYFRYGIGRIINKITVLGDLPTNWNSIIYIRDGQTNVGDIYYTGTNGNILSGNNATIYYSSINNPNGGTTIANTSSTINNKIEQTKYGVYTRNGSGVNYINLPHGLGVTPSFFQVQKNIGSLPDIDYVIADSSYLKIFFKEIVANGTNNVVLNWYAKV